jgi:hypothetical protein
MSARKSGRLTVPGGLPARDRLARAQSKCKPSDPCLAGVDLLTMQVLFLQAQRDDPALAVMAPDFGIDPEFWGPGCAARALRLIAERQSARTG